MSDELAAWMRRNFPMLDPEQEVRQLDPEYQAVERRRYERAAAEQEARHQQELLERMRASVVAHAEWIARQAEWERRQRENALKAAETMRKNRALPGYMRPGPERVKAIVAMRDQGKTYRAISEQIGLSAQRVRHILTMQDHLRERMEEREAAKAEHEAMVRHLDAKRRAKYVVDLAGVEPATDWRTPEQEWADIAAGR